MKEKVTSYEISKKLHELGFESESHYGWWYKEYGCAKVDDKYQICWYPYDDLNEEQVECKAYDCWDLLRWLYNNEPINQVRALIIAHKFWYKNEFLDTNDYDDDQPQNALGLAVIKILEEKEESVG